MDGTERLLRSRCFLSLFDFFLSVDHPIVILLRKYNEDKQAELVARGELTDLQLSFCKIGDAGAEIVASFLVDNKTVTEAVLWGCAIGSRGLKAIAEALKVNRTLQILDLDDNEIGDEDAEALRGALNYNVCISEIYISDNDIALESAATIKYLAKSRNRILIPSVVRRCSLYLIFACRTIASAGMFAIFPSEIVARIAMHVWATRSDPIWIEAVSGAKHVARQAHCVEMLLEEMEAEADETESDDDFYNSPPHSHLMFMRAEKLNG